MFVFIGGRRMYLWRAVDQDGEVLDVLLHSKRDKGAALKLIRKLLKKLGFAPRTLVTDKWRAYAASTRELSLQAWRHKGRWKNNRIENAHQPVRRRERKMQGFKSPGSAQRFLSVHTAFYNHFNTRRHLVSAPQHRQCRDAALSQWREATAVAAYGNASSKPTCVEAQDS
jgi:transposase-like protein